MKLKYVFFSSFLLLYLSTDLHIDFQAIVLLFVTSFGDILLKLIKLFDKKVVSIVVNIYKWSTSIIFTLNIYCVPDCVFLKLSATVWPWNGMWWEGSFTIPTSCVFWCKHPMEQNCRTIKNVEIYQASKSTGAQDHCSQEKKKNHRKQTKIGWWGGEESWEKELRSQNANFGPKIWLKPRTPGPPPGAWFL